MSKQTVANLPSVRYDARIDGL